MGHRRRNAALDRRFFGSTDAFPELRFTKLKLPLMIPKWIARLIFVSMPCCAGASQIIRDVAHKDQHLYSNYDRVGVSRLDLGKREAVVNCRRFRVGMSPQ